MIDVIKDDVGVVFLKVGLAHVLRRRVSGVDGGSTGPDDLRQRLHLLGWNADAEDFDGGVFFCHG